MFYQLKNKHLTLFKPFDFKFINSTVEKTTVKNTSTSN